MADKPKYVEKFISYSSVQAKRGLWRSILAERMEFAKFLIANTYNVNADRVKDIFLSAWDNSTKDYPSPTHARPQNPKEWESFNNYIVYLWEYYVENSGTKKDLPKEKDKGALVPTDDSSQQEPPGKEKLYEGVSEEDLVDEDVDERILKLLGLDNVFDIDYATYMSLLRERMAAARMSGTSIPTEEAELLTNEWKRVKGKVGRFRIKRKSVNTEGFGGGPLAIRTGSFFVAQKVAFPEKEEGDKKLVGLAAIADDIAAIRKTVESIADLMTQQISMIKKELEKDRRLKEGKKRQDKENLLEKGGKAVLALAKKMLSPVQSLLDRIIKFLTTVLVGHLVLKLFQWFADPANKKKVDTIFRFIKDWWPALLAAFLLFGTSAGALIRTVLGTLTKLTITMARKGIPMLLNFIRKNPYVAGALAIGGTALLANEVTGQRKAAGIQADQQSKVDRGKALSVQGTDTMADKMPSTGNLRPASPTGSLQGASGGGLIKGFAGGGEQMVTPYGGDGEITKETGVTVAGAGRDTQLTALRPKEFVLVPGAAQELGIDRLKKLNKKHGGTNAPKFINTNNVQLAYGGGLIGKGLNALGNLGLPGTGSVMAPRYTDMGYQNKFLGMNLNRIRLPQITGQQFSQPEVQRYNQKSKSSFIRDWSPYDPVQVSVPKPRPVQSGSFMGSNVRQNNGIIQKRIQAQIRAMKQLGQESDGYDTMFNRHPAVMQPQSNVLPKRNMTVASNISPPVRKVEVTATTIERKRNVKGQQSVGQRDIDTTFDVAYSSSSRRKNLAIYGIKGVA